jgi:hypothetical protein
VGWRIELRCDTRECTDLTHPVVGSSVKNVSADARAQGWGQDRDGLWRCRLCAPSFGVPSR